VERTAMAAKLALKVSTDLNFGAPETNFLDFT
jgi:hypothetical protein